MNRPIAEDIAFAQDLTRIVLHAEMALPGLAIARLPIPCGGSGTVMPAAQTQDVIRPSRLGIAEDRLFPAAERLPLYYRAGRAAVDVAVADRNVGFPPGDFPLIQRVQAARQTELPGIHDVHRLSEIPGADQAQHGPKTLGSVIPRAGCDPQFNPR